MRFLRRAADRMFGLYARYRVRGLERISVADVQLRTLMTLVRWARHTRFGKDHGFDNIRTVQDYQARVPLRDYDALWRDYWQTSFPNLTGVTWPEKIPYFALSSGTTTGSTKYIPVSNEMLQSNRRAGLTGLSWFRAARSDAPLFTGRLFFLGGSTDCSTLGHYPSRFPWSREVIRAGDLSGIVAQEVPAFLRPFTFPPRDIALLKDWERKVQLLAERSAGLPITLVGGVPSWLLVLFERLQQVTGRDCIGDIWPSLRLVIHGGTSFEPYRSLFRRLIGREDVYFQETYPASEGFVAAEDPRWQLLRLIPDHGIFFEFVPVDELGKDRPTRHTAADVVPGVQYAVVLTTCAGLWSYVIGDTVCFERRDPPLLRFTGRTRYGLSAFGEHLIAEEIERAVAEAARATGSAVVDFHVGPVFPESRGQTGRHRYLVEFAEAPRDLTAFARAIDAALCRINEDYQAHRVGDLTMLEPEVHLVRRGGFAGWMRSRGKLGGQHKVPRMDNSGRWTQEISRWMGQHAPSTAAVSGGGS